MTSNRGSVTKVAPPNRARPASTTSPTAWKNGATARIRSSGVTGDEVSICSTLVRQARWVSSTPLASPVVPLE